MRVLHLADLHIYLSGPRAEECRRIIDWIAANARETKPDVIVIAGDVYERRSTPQERIYLAELLRSLSDVARVFIINGNHDDKDDLRLFCKEYGWTMPIDVILDPTAMIYKGASFFFLPWPSLGNFAAKAGAGESIVARRELARAALIDVLRGFRTHSAAAEGKPSLLIAHISVTGASMDSGQPVSGGEELALTADELLESDAGGVALGHIHLRQQMKGLDSRPVHYAGAPFRGSFGEAKGTKGGLIWDWSGAAWEVTPWEIPARSMVLIERAYALAETGELAPIGGTLFDEAIVKDADIRVRVTFPSEHREAMRAAIAPELEALRAVAHLVTVEERASIVSRTRCAEITAARTTMEKLAAWAQAVGAEVPAGAEAKLRALEAEITI
ncbi:MAG: metallophosphoesterase [Acidobacteria bacterium]|nr:metallophosphoesterase [Acidobacteriota bacterium]